ncbi:hypothetical protein CR513_34206, partial [Mucuna pruriens]
MLTIFGFQNVIEVVTLGFVEPSRNVIEEQRLIFKQQQKLDTKARFLIYQCVNSKIFNKISNASTSKEACEILMKTYELVSAMKTYKEKVTNQQAVEKILRTLPLEFDYVAIAIEESEDLDTMEVEELQHSLEAHEMRINKKRSIQEQAMHARSNYNGKGEESWKSNKLNTNQDQGYGETSESFKGRKKTQA